MPEKTQEQETLQLGFSTWWEKFGARVQMIASMNRYSDISPRDPLREVALAVWVGARSFSKVALDREDALKEEIRTLSAALTAAQSKLSAPKAIAFGCVSQDYAVVLFEDGTTRFSKPQPPIENESP